MAGCASGWSSRAPRCCCCRRSRWLAPDSYVPLDAALRLPQQFHWLVVTSANAVRVIGERLAALALDVQPLAQLRCAAVGPATAEAMRSIGLTVALMPERYVAEALAEALTDRARGQRVLLVRAAVARDVVPDALKAAGATVTVVDAYRTVVPADAVDACDARCSLRILCPMRLCLPAAPQ